MSIHFHPLRVADLRRETADCVSVSFEVPDEIKSLFAFKAGQSLSFRTTINGEEVRRTYSLCSSPLDNEWRVAIKQVEGGVFSTWANTSLKKGDQIDVMPPVGNFCLYTKAGHHFLAVAAGSGITPVLSLIKTTLASDNHTSFTLIYGNRNRQSVIFAEALEALKNRYMERLSIHYIFSREHTDVDVQNGRIDAAKLQSLSSLVDYAGMSGAFLCGPEDLIFTTSRFLESAGLDKKKIHFELFTSPGQNTVSKSGTATASATGCEVSLQIDGRQLNFTIPAGSDQTILDAALAAGADLPYACKGGMCCTCKAKLTEGKVEMDVHWGLEDEEVKNGFILTCQSHPKSEKIRVDFDNR